MLYGKFTDAVQKRGYYPAVVQSGNRFAYCAGNPVMFADPWGVYRSSWDEANLTDDELELIDQYTHEWNVAKATFNADGMQEAHKKAEEIRNRHRGFTQHGWERGFDDGNTGTGGSKYPSITPVDKSFGIIIEDAKFLPSPNPKIIDFDINMGVGLYGKVNIDGADVEVGAKASANVIDDIMSGEGNRPPRTFTASALVALAGQIKAGVSYENQYLQEDGHSIGDSVMVGVQRNGVSAGYQGNAKDKNDFVIDVGAGIYFIVGIDVNLRVNVSELIRKVEDFCNNG